MANKKITDLDALSSVADGDLVEIVDVSDTTDSAEGSSKKITKSNLTSDKQDVLAEGAFVDGDKTKLDGIETGADVTDATNVAAAGAVLNTGNESIDGVKTFTSFPVTPSAAPTTDYQAANKKYVDDNAGGSDDWNAAGETWTYAASDDPTYTFTISAFDATSKYSPGMKIRLTDSGTQYFFITKVVFDDPGSTITIYGGTDYDLSSGTITNPYYSTSKSPLNFPLDPSVWTVEVTDSTHRTQSTPTTSTWYNVGTTNSQIEIPIGLWKVSYQVALQAENSSAQNAAASVTLSKANNSEDDAQLTSYHKLTYAGGNQDIRQYVTHYKEKVLNLTAKDTYYLNGQATEALTVLGFINDKSDLVIRAKCEYL